VYTQDLLAIGRKSLNTSDLVDLLGHIGDLSFPMIISIFLLLKLDRTLQELEREMGEMKKEWAELKEIMLLKNGIRRTK